MTFGWMKRGRASDGTLLGGVGTAPGRKPNLWGDDCRELSGRSERSQGSVVRVRLGVVRLAGSTARRTWSQAGQLRMVGPATAALPATGCVLCL